MVTLTEAVAGRLLLHVPPVGVADNVVVAAAHIDAVPVMASGLLFTDTVTVRLQPVVSWYFITDVPASIPLTIPALTVAFAILLLLHTPPAGVLTSVVVRPSHTDVVPVIAVGNAFTVTIAVLKQVPEV